MEDKYNFWINRINGQLADYISRRVAHYYVIGAISSMDYKALTKELNFRKNKPDRLLRCSNLQPYIEEAVDQLTKY